MFCGSWNVNAKKIEDDDSLSEWLRPPGTGLFDVYIVRCVSRSFLSFSITSRVNSFQEIVDLNAVNVAVDSKSQQRSSFWADKVNECLAQSSDKFEMVQKTPALFFVPLAFSTVRSHLKCARWCVNIWWACCLWFVRRRFWFLTSKTLRHLWLALASWV